MPRLAACREVHTGSRCRQLINRFRSINTISPSTFTRPARGCSKVHDDRKPHVINKGGPSGEPGMTMSESSSIEDIISLLTAAQSMAEDAGHLELAGQIAIAIGEALQIAMNSAESLIPR